MNIFKLCILLALLLPIFGNAQTLFVFKGTNGLAIAASRGDLISYDLGPRESGGGGTTQEHPDRVRWRADTGLPLPAIWPAVVDKETAIAVQVVGTNADAAINELAVAVANHPIGQRNARIRDNRASNAFTTMTNNMSQFVGNYTDFTNLVATSSFTSNQLKNIFGKQAKAMDAIYDVLKKVVPVLRSNVEEQK